MNIKDAINHMTHYIKNKREFLCQNVKIKERREFHHVEKHPLFLYLIGNKAIGNTWASGRLMDDVEGGADWTSVVKETSKTNNAMEKWDNLVDS